MKIEISNFIKLKPKDEEEKKIIRNLLAKDLVFPSVNADNSRGRFKTNQPYVCYKYNNKSNYFSIPKGRISILNKLSYDPNIKFEELKDLRTVGKDIKDFKCNFDFRDEIQKGAFKAYIENPSKIGIINLSCGLGE